MGILGMQFCSFALGKPRAKSLVIIFLLIGKPWRIPHLLEAKDAYVHDVASYYCASYIRNDALKALSKQNQKPYVPICLVDDSLDVPLIIYDSVKAITCSSGGLLAENIISTFSVSCCVDKMAVCLRFYLHTINIKWLLVHICGNNESVCVWLGHVRQVGHVYFLQ